MFLEYFSILSVEVPEYLGRCPKKTEQKLSPVVFLARIRTQKLLQWKSCDFQQINKPTPVNKVVHPPAVKLPWQTRSDEKEQRQFELCL